MGQIVIELLSDGCISSGEAYNSSIDSDVCYDSYGLPFIPAKRIRGCLREAALELKDFGMDIDIDKLFGKAGNERSAYILGNARLKDYEAYLRELQDCTREEYKHQQTVLDQFTYVRYQTRIEKESGTAEDTSLRAIRVMKKGLVFVADMEVPEEYREIIRCCCKNFRFMGMNRTRGMGEVRVSFSEKSREKVRPKHKEWVEGIAYDRLDYQIRLKSPMLIKSVAGGQTRTIQYIDGVKILGLLAGKLSGEGLMKLQEQGKLICSNAYISDGSVRYTPVSAALYGIKDENGQVRDRACQDAEDKSNKEGKQLVQLNGSYVDDDTALKIKRLTVDTEIRYHHSRPNDKSVGHVKGNDVNSQDGGSFYQMESIAEGQVFAGYILGTTQQLKTIYDIFVENPWQRIGYGKTSEYGDTELTVTSLEVCKAKEQKCSSFVVKLNSPVILYNENGMYDAKEDILRDYVAVAIKEKNNLMTMPNLKVINRFLKYGTVGGFNTTWGLHKPVINTFDAGTTLVFDSDIDVDIGRMRNIFLGERISEGYGEASFYQLSNKYKKEFMEPETAAVVSTADDAAVENSLIQLIATKRAYEYIKEQARRRADKVDTKGETMNAVIANLLMMCRQQETFEGFQKNIEARFKDKAGKSAKLETAYKIIPADFKIRSEIEKTQKRYPEAVLAEEKVYKIYVMAILTALKYKVREEKE